MPRKKLITLKLTEEQYAVLMTLMELYKYEADLLFKKELTCITYKNFLKKVKRGEF